MREHPGEVEAEDLAAGLRDDVLGRDPGGPADDERGRARDVGLGRCPRRTRSRMGRRSGIRRRRARLGRRRGVLGPATGSRNGRGLRGRRRACRTGGPLFLGARRSTGPADGRRPSGADRLATLTGLETAPDGVVQRARAALGGRERGLELRLGGRRQAGLALEDPAQLRQA